MMTRKNPRLFRWLPRFVCMTGLCLTNLAWAGVVVTGTRVIYPEGDREVTIKLDNNGDMPALVQTWVDKGDPNVSPDAVEAPFVLTPPVFRMEPAKGQTLRLAYTRESLPEDRETVFWLNVLDIPPKASGTVGENVLQMAIRTRIKIFFRPAVLDAEGASEAVRGMAWKLVPAPQGDGYAVLASNPSPYYVNVAAIRIKQGQQQFDVKDGAMIAPGASQRFAFDRPLPAIPPRTEFDYTAINDLGALVPLKAVLNSAP
jgi:chaperone protein EcpD